MLGTYNYRKILFRIDSVIDTKKKEEKRKLGTFIE
jgi:hypothetical protein